MVTSAPTVPPSGPRSTQARRGVVGRGEGSSMEEMVRDAGIVIAAAAALYSAFEARAVRRELMAVREDLAAGRAVGERTAAALDAHVNAAGLHAR